MRNLLFTEWFECLAGDWTSQKWEAHMGASHEVGRNESCIWGFALPAVVQSIHRPASAAPVAVDPWSPWRIWVFCLRGGQTNGAQRHLTVSKARFLVCPSWPELRWTSPPWGCPWCVGNRGRQAGPVGPKRLTTPRESLYSNSNLLM